MADERQVTMATKKLKALKEGIVTDVVFLVGVTDATAQEIRAIRSDLVVSSEFFVSLLDSPLTLKRDGKIRLKNIEPKIFQLLIEFTHLSGQLVSEVDSLDCCLKLALAADEYMIDDLGPVCSKLLEGQFLTVDNVWTALSQHVRVKAISSACLKILGSKTSDCLKHPSFLEASEEAVKLFCGLDKMNIQSELELLEACLRYTKIKENQRGVFRQCCLPGLRLLALDSADLAKVFPMLTLEEKTSIAAWKSPLMAAEKPKLASGLCPISNARSDITGGQTLNLVPDSHVLGVRDVFLTECFVACPVIAYEPHRDRCWVTLELSPKRSIRISGFEIFNSLDLTNEVFDNSAGTFGRVVEITLTVDNRRTLWSYSLSDEVTVPELFPFNGWTFFKHSALVPAGSTFTLNVQFSRNSFLRTQKFTMDLVKSTNSSAAFDVFSQIGIFYNSKMSTYLQQVLPADTKLCIFKSINFTAEI
ncbi:uncharacterized protein LOC135936982 [Cloeon dipterum]|uniref:uncharacterized protein LOC135936982 n=1 Tax=Cloeon dipterum TaxID=197152 RepID=UPI0032202CB8